MSVPVDDVGLAEPTTILLDSAARRSSLDFVLEIAQAEVHPSARCFLEVPQLAGTK